MTAAEWSVSFVLALFAIVAAARIVGWLGRRFLDQPRVMGEMVAGVLLGPSLLGLVAPEVQAALFPADVRGALYIVSQLGIGLYMLLVGLDFDPVHLRSRAVGAGAVSLSGMAAPFLVAVPMTLWLMGRPGLFPPEVGQVQATLFMGACISITAFPVLARIVEERGLSRSPLAAMTLSAGAIGDALAWSVLALVLAMSGAGAFAMDWTGLLVTLGGFLLGAAMPRGPRARALRAKLAPVTIVLLVPIFFAWSGLNTQLGLIGDPGLLLVAAVVLAASILAKLGACWAAARLTGQDNPTALGIGALMNARGMMELIILDVGLQRGLIGVELFSILVLMAVVTTFMATPLFEVVYGRRARERGELGSLAEASPEPVHATRE